MATPIKNTFSILLTNLKSRRKMVGNLLVLWRLICGHKSPKLNYTSVDVV